LAVQDIFLTIRFLKRQFFMHGLLNDSVYYRHDLDWDNKKGRF